MRMNKDRTKNKKTTDHEEIQKWVEARDGKPARIKGSAVNPPLGYMGGILSVDFGMREENLERMGWDDFFGVFDANDLAFLYQEETADGGTSRFFKFVRHDDPGDETMLDEEDREIIEDVDAEGRDEGEEYPDDEGRRSAQDEDA